MHCRVFRAFSHLSCASHLEVSDGVVLMPCCKCAKDRPCVRCYCVENGRPCVDCYPRRGSRCRNPLNSKVLTSSQPLTSAASSLCPPSVSQPAAAAMTVPTSRLTHSQSKSQPAPVVDRWALQPSSPLSVSASSTPSNTSEASQVSHEGDVGRVSLSSQPNVVDSSTGSHPSQQHITSSLPQPAAPSRDDLFAQQVISTFDIVTKWEKESLHCSIRCSWHRFCGGALKADRRIC